MKKILRILGAALALMVYCNTFFMPVAHAYIDPSTTTYLIQAIAGIAVAVGSVVVIYWRKAKKRLNDKMGINLDKNKEVEDDFQIVQEKNNEDF